MRRKEVRKKGKKEGLEERKEVVGSSLVRFCTMQFCEITIGLVNPVSMLGTLWCLGCLHKAGWKKSQITKPPGNAFLIGSILLFPSQGRKSE